MHKWCINGEQKDRTKTLCRVIQTMVSVDYDVAALFMMVLMVRMVMMVIWTGGGGGGDKCAQ